MSAKTMAASNGKRRIGCSVASAAISGLRQKAMKSAALARSSRYSGSERPGLAHEPDRRPLQGLAGQGAQQAGRSRS